MAQPVMLHHFSQLLFDGLLSYDLGELHWKAKVNFLLIKKAALERGSLYEFYWTN